ncbi:MAG: hypothetical protein H6679_05400 [Epsilonproteobacteria bacterium]|nr:hypothetical protein [Campylobacterota bacterium]
MNTVEKNFYEIYDYYYTPLTQTTSFKVVSTVLIIAACSVIAWFLYKRKKEAELTPWQWANLELSKLSPEAYTKKDDYKKFYFALTSVIKKYLHKRYSWSTEDKTDQELIELLRKHQFDPTLLEMLDAIKDGALWVKFANEQALKAQLEADLETTLQLVKQTTPTKK